ncbi:hypothetical protein SAMN05443246_1298 [Paenibacillus sp. GP183]|nr:hypothetical protein SAMN05443246_1298 [Paenibacillus sp. GP183]
MVSKVKWLIFSSFLILGVIAILSLFLLRRHLHPIMIIYGIFIATILNDQFFTIFGFNLQLFKPAPGWIPYIVKTLYFVALCPTQTLWLMFILFWQSVPSALKWLALLVFTAFHGLVDYSLVFAGYVQLINWNPGFSFIRNLVDASIVYLILAATRKLLRRRGATA